jgi:integrase
VNLSDAIAEFEEYRTNSGYAANTVRAEKQALGYALVCLGNIQVKNITAVHGERFKAYLIGKRLKPNSVNAHLSAFKRFCTWARERRFLPQNTNPMATTRLMRVESRPRNRVDAADFPRLLDACDNPQQRVIVALGLYLFLRSSEIKELRIGSVNLDRGEVLVYQPKTGRYDEMPICAELDTELRRWLTWYAEDAGPVHGPLDPEWFLVPARMPMTLENPEGGRGNGRPVPRGDGLLNPTRRVGKPHQGVQKALNSIGWRVEGDREGCHTLRRSGARALFDTLVESGEVRDGVLRLVSSMLHHKGATVTEHYLGLEADVERRNEMFKSRRMFAAPADNVVALVAD